MPIDYKNKEERQAIELKEIQLRIDHIEKIEDQIFYNDLLMDENFLDEEKKLEKDIVNKIDYDIDKLKEVKSIADFFEKLF